MAVIKSGATSDQLTIDATSKAARVTLYDSRGNNMGQLPTYAAATDGTVAAAASATAPFFVLYGSASKTIRLMRLMISGPTTTTLAIQGVTIRKYSSAPSGGTAVALNQVPLDSNNSAATASLCQVYTAAPTAGTTVGVISSVRMLNKSTTVVDGSNFSELIYDIPVGYHGEALTLRGTTQGVGLQLVVATATTLSVSVMWTEE